MRVSRFDERSFVSVCVCARRGTGALLIFQALFLYAQHVTGTDALIVF